MHHWLREMDTPSKTLLSNRPLDRILLKLIKIVEMSSEHCICFAILGIVLWTYIANVGL